MAEADAAPARRSRGGEWAAMTDDLTAAGSATWRGAVDSEAALAACIATLGILPLQDDAPLPGAPAPPWPSLAMVRAPGASTAEAWMWGGRLVAARTVFCGHVLGGPHGLAFTSLDLFVPFFALAPGADYTAVYLAGQIHITAKAIADVLLSKGPLKTQQIRQALRLHKRFLAHDVPAAMAELERALLIVAGGPELAAPWVIGAVPGGAPISRWQRQIAQDLDLRVWELTARWAPPALLAAADRLREQPATAREFILNAARALAPGRDAAAVRAWLGWTRKEDLTNTASG